MKLACDGSRTKSASSLLSVRELGKSLPPETKNVVPLSSRRSWIYSLRKQILKIQRQWLFLRKVLSYQMLMTVRMLEHVKPDLCAVTMLFLRNLQHLHLWLMETRHWAGLGMAPEWLFPHLSQMCSLLPPTFKPHACLLFTGLSVHSGIYLYMFSTLQIKREIYQGTWLTS